MQENLIAKRQPVKKYYLNSAKIIVENTARKHCLIIQGQNTGKLIQPEPKPNLIEIRFKIGIHETLNECLKKSVSLFQIWTKSYQLTFCLKTRQGEYCFEEMNYFMFLEVDSNIAVDQKQLKVLSQNQILKRTQAQLVIVIHRSGLLFQQFYKAKEISVVVGSEEENGFIRSEISNFSLQTFVTQQTLTPSKKPEVKFIYKDRQFSRPLGLFTHSSQIYKSLQILQNFTIQSFQSFIENLPNHTIDQNQSQNKIYICHDMKGGYVEDLNFDHNIEENLKIYNIAYRSFQLQQAEIFNYFSHYNITVPTKHWRILCKRYGTKCLGTFITEKQDYDQNMLNSKQFALFLIAIAKKCKFDGYLINIERKIKNITFFRQWIEYLTKKMHHFLPNSLVIWYDSILPKDGNISYQNALTRENYQFYHLTDGIFTNYWWDQQSLKLSNELKGNNKRKVYIGNDCFGRNTYGGGKYDIYKAANKILQYKNQLSIALFAPGFTYQTGGEYNRYQFHLNQYCIYKGVNGQLIVLDKWKQSKKDKNSGGWQKQNQWSVSSYHYNSYCQKSALLKFAPLQIGQSVRVVFMSHVASTLPLIGSPYKIVLQLLNGSGETLLQTDVHNFINFKKTTDQTELLIMELDASSQILGSNDISVRIIVLAKSKQNWGGYFGPRFKNECVNVLIYEKERHWISKIPINQVIIDSPFHSYCNSGVGDYFFYEGLKFQKYYNFLADMDTPHTHIINNPLETDFSYEQAFIGGSSLTIRKELIKLLKIIIPSTINLQEEYYIQITAKNAQNVNLAFKYLSKNQQERVFSAKVVKTQDVNGWKKYTFRLTTTLKVLKYHVRSIIQLSSVRYPYNLGQIKFIKGKGRQSQLIKCTLQTSKEMLQTSKYYFNLTIIAKTHKRLYIMIGKVGAFAYFDEGLAILKNLPLQKCQSFEVQIIDTDECLENKTLIYKVIDSNAICDLIFNGSIQL